MRGFILPAAIPVITEGGHHFHAEIPLALLGVILVQEGIVHLRLRRNFADQFYLFGAQFAEDRLHFAGLHPRLVIVQQRIVGMIHRREQRGVLPHQIDDFFQLRLESGEIIVGARALPDLMPHRGGLGHRRHHAGRHAGLLVVVPRGHFHQSRIVRIRVQARGFLLQVVQQAAHLFRGGFLVRQRLQHSQLLAAAFKPAGGHVHLHIPAQHGRGSLQRMDFCQQVFQLIQFLFHMPPSKSSLAAFSPQGCTGSMRFRPLSSAAASGRAPPAPRWRYLRRLAPVPRRSARQCAACRSPWGG